MKVLLMHNRYRNRGGEDQVFEDETRVLLERGHEVIPVTARWDAAAPLLSLPGRARDAAWSAFWHRRTRGLIEEYRPDLLHAHNLFPVLSPSPLEAAREAGIPAVVTLHNYRLHCAGANLFREGRPCEDCLGTHPWRGALHGCYHGSRLQSAAVAWAMASQRARGSWDGPVDRFIAPSAFARRKIIQGGIPAEKILVKPHCVHPDPGPGAGDRDAALWVGRRSPEKGLDLALAAWRKGGLPPLRVAAAGAGDRNAASESVSGIEWLPYVRREDLLGLMKRARFLLSTSRCYETFGLVVAEAFACATPAVVPSGGALAELVEDGTTGLHFRSGDPDSLAEKVQWAWGHPREMRTMGEAARSVFDKQLTAEVCANNLENVYRQVMGTL